MKMYLVPRKSRLMLSLLLLLSLFIIFGILFHQEQLLLVDYAMVLKSINIAARAPILPSSVPKIYNRNKVEAISSPLSLPGIYHSLPHLLKNKNALNPDILLSGKRENVSLVFAMPTVKRESKTYLIQTLLSMIKHSSAAERNDMLIIISIADLDNTYRNQVVSLIKHHFLEHVNSGLIDVIAPKPEFYPSFDNLPATYGDSDRRVRWRSKQNLDYAFLMMYGQSKAKYYVQMDDDVIAAASYVTTMKSFANSQKSNWFLIEFCSIGSVGKLLKSSDLFIFIEFSLMFYKDKPNDWLLDDIIKTKTLGKGAPKIRYKPAQFQPVGKQSSLKGKIMDMEDETFKG